MNANVDQEVEKFPTGSFKSPQSSDEYEKKGVVDLQLSTVERLSNA